MFGWIDDSIPMQLLSLKVLMVHSRFSCLFQGPVVLICIGNSIRTGSVLALLDFGVFGAHYPKKVCGERSCQIIRNTANQDPKGYGETV